MHEHERPCYLCGRTVDCDPGYPLWVLVVCPVCLRSVQN